MASIASNALVNADGFTRVFEEVTVDDLLAWVRMSRQATDRSQLSDAGATAMETAWETVMGSVGPPDWRFRLVEDLDTDALTSAYVARSGDPKAAFPVDLSIYLFQCWAEGVTSHEPDRPAKCHGR